MPGIKTRESLRTIKTFDRAKTLGQKVKNGAGEVKEYGEELQNTRYGSANEYAGNAVENTERRTARNVAYGAGKIGNWGLKETRKNILKWRDRQKKFKVKVQQPKPLPAPKRPALPSAKATAKTAQKGVKTAQQTAKATVKTAKVTVKAAQRAVQAAKVAAKAAVKFAKVSAKAVVAAVKATVVAIKGIAAAKANGMKFGRPVIKAPDNFPDIVQRWERGTIRAHEAAELCGMCESTFYHRLREYRASLGDKKQKSL